MLYLMLTSVELTTAFYCNKRKITKYPHNLKQITCADRQDELY
jgi:hypothetical protein